MVGMTTPTFAETLAAAHRGDDAAFTVLFRLGQPAVLRYLSVVSRDRAEDLAAETWLQVVRGLDTFSGAEPGAFRAWILSIARHRWLDDCRARGRRPQVSAYEPPDRPAEDDVAAAVDEIVTTESALDLIAQLPPDQAEVIALRFIADLDVASTAALVGKAPGAVRVLTHRGLRRLETILRAGSRADQV
jgi:RNA polymerase sigma-70 factor (ECF subfamily)